MRATISAIHARPAPQADLPCAASAPQSACSAEARARGCAGTRSTMCTSRRSGSRTRSGSSSSRSCP